MAKKGKGNKNVTEPIEALAKRPSKKEKEPAFNLRKELEQQAASLEKQFKRPVLLTASRMSNVYQLRRPTGILSLDRAIGGGFPAGGLSQLIGRESTGKSYIANRVMANVQTSYGNQAAIAICMTEMKFDKNFAKWKCGLDIAFAPDEIDLGEQSLGRPYTPEEREKLESQTGYIYMPDVTVAEQVLEIAAQLVESGLYQIVFVDSMGSLLTKAEEEADHGIIDKHYGGAAMVITAFMHRVHSALCSTVRGRPNTTTLLVINQARDVIGNQYGPQGIKIGGGNALKHGKLTDVLLSSLGFITIDQGERKPKLPIGKEVGFDIIKGKAGCHDGVRGSYNYYYGEHGYGFGVDIYGDLLNCSVMAGLVEQSGAWFSCEGKNLGQGKEAAAIALFEDPALAERLRTAVLAKDGISFVTRENW